MFDLFLAFMFWVFAATHHQPCPPQAGPHIVEDGVDIGSNWSQNDACVLHTPGR